MIIADLAFSIDLKSLSYGSSKLFQVVLPLGVVIFFQQLPFRKKLFQKLIQLTTFNSALNSEQEKEELLAYERRFDRLLGFFSWKIGCDLGFFLLNTEFGTWERAFTFAGLIPYTIVQYLAHRIVGQNMVMDGFINPFMKDYKSPKPTMKRTHPFRQLFSKYFYEDMGVTNSNMRLRRVLLKPLVDYTSMVASWSAYTIGIFFFQSGEINLAPLVHFSHQTMLCFYLVGYFGYILGYNLGELLFFGILTLTEQLAVASREGKQFLTSGEEQFGSLLERLKYHWKELKYTVILQFQPFLARYGINIRWMMSVTCGVILVVLLTPGFTRFFASVSENVNQLWFDSLGQMNQAQVEQITVASGSGKLPDSQIIVEEFPTLWAQMYNHGVEIASDY
ncbi:MAG: hypothetical protein AB4426_28945 [Xenococcaceae cyanobacterium]